ncbi:MAG: VOC family protein [Oscillospiraceae bacterium]
MDRKSITMFLTFPGVAEEAMEYYASNLPGAEIADIVRYGSAGGEDGADKVLNGILTLKGQEIMFMDMIGPSSEFSWAMSIYVDCVDEAEFDAFFDALSRDGTVMMGPEAVGNLRKVAWVTDKLGVTWQPVWE